MTNKTMNLLLKHWKGKKPNWMNPQDFPFDLDAFCEETDNLIESVQTKTYSVRAAAGNGLWFQNDKTGEGMGVSDDTMDEIFKEFM